MGKLRLPNVMLPVAVKPVALAPDSGELTALAAVDFGVGEWTPEGGACGVTRVGAFTAGEAGGFSCIDSLGEGDVGLGSFGTGSSAGSAAGVGEGGAGGGGTETVSWAGVSGGAVKSAMGGVTVEVATGAFSGTEIRSTSTRLDCSPSVSVVLPSKPDVLIEKSSVGLRNPNPKIAP